MEQRFAQEIVENLNTGAIVLDRSLLVVGINPAGEDLLGVSRERARGRPLLELAGDDPQLAELVRRVLSTGLTFADELKLAPTDRHPEHRVVDCRVSPMQGESTPNFLLVEMIDVTRRSRISRENALIMQHGAGRQMIRQLAHEIKNPLGGLRGAAQLLARLPGGTELREYTDVIISEADRLAALVDTLLGPGGPPHKRWLNVHELVEYVLKLVEPELAAVAVRRDYDPGLPLIELDRDQMVQALLNLVQNALAALAGQGTLVVRTRAATNFTIGEVRHRAIASIEIEDDGPGIPPALQDSIFYPLVTGRPDGTGLGLSVAQDLLARHGGLIEFESRPGKTVFFVRIPLAAERGDDA